MTDLITKLADDLHALINSSPRSPTKEEIAAVLRQHPDFTHPMIVTRDHYTLAEALADVEPGGVIYVDHGGRVRRPSPLQAAVREQNEKWVAETWNRPAGYLVSQEGLEKAIADLYTQAPASMTHSVTTTPVGMAVMPLPYKDISGAVTRLMDEVRERGRKETEEAFRILASLGCHPEGTRD